MLKRLRFRPLGWAVALSTLVAASATMALTAGGAAAAGEATYTSTFELPCVISPGGLNIKAKLGLTTSAKGPASVTPGQSVEFTSVQSTITTPVELTESFVAFGATEARGEVNNFVLDQSLGSPAQLNIANPSLPYHAPVEQGKSTKFVIPSLKVGENTDTFSFGPITVTGKAGENYVSTIDAAEGYEEVGNNNYKSTGEGIQSTTEGYNAKGESVLGPLGVACSAPEHEVLATIPIVAGTTTTSSTSTSTSSTTTSTTTTTSKTTTTTTTTSTKTTEGPIPVTFKNWVLKGSLTDKKLNEKITLPAGSTFNGTGSIPGPLTGDTSVPPFKASIKIFGLLPTTLGITFTEVGHTTGTITPTASGELNIKGTAKDNIGITGVGLLGLNIPVTCKTAEAVTFPLETTAPASALVKGLTFNGITTLPKVNCEGGLLGGLFGPIITELMSGPSNPFSLTIEP